MPLNKKLPIAISMGEPGGINIEIIFKCIKKKLPVFFLIADPDWVAKSIKACLLYTSPSPRDRQKSRMPSSA